jgi:exopolysaccharide biosynthesis protein
MESDDIILFITDKKYDGITLLELAKIAQDKSGFNCKIAINLDGGPAPGISVSPKLINLEIKEGWQLPNAIIFNNLKTQ